MIIKFHQDYTITNDGYVLFVCSTTTIVFNAAAKISQVFQFVPSIPVTIKIKNLSIEAGI